MIQCDRDAAGRLKGHHVLVVEDEMLLALDIADEVERAGGEVDMAGSARMALKLIATQQFDVAVLDFQLADGNSLPVAAELRSRQVPFIFVTAQGHLPELRECHPDTAIFDKPMMANRMRATLETMLRPSPDHAHA